VIDLKAPTESALQGDRKRLAIWPIDKRSTGMFDTVISRRKMVIASAAVFAAAPLAGYGIVSAQTEYEAPDDITDLSGSIEADGSSTVAPFTEAVIEEFAAVAPGVAVTNGVSGTGGGFKRFVEGETALSNASRPIAEDEVEIAATAGVNWYEFEVCYDGLSIVVNPANDWVDSLTVEQLRDLWIEGSTVTNWSDLNPDGQRKQSNSMARAPIPVRSTTSMSPSSATTWLLAPTTSQAKTTTYWFRVWPAAPTRWATSLCLLRRKFRLPPCCAIDGGNGPVEPTHDTIADGSYAPLSRPLFEYVNAEMLQSDPALQEFMRFMLASSGPLAEDVGYIALPGEEIQAQQDKLEGAISGELAPDSAAVEATPTA
jgi:phosphate transport system substrate-binding protein